MLINKKKDFNPIGLIDSSSVKKAFDFSMDMTFNEKGEHRAHRSGGRQIRGTYGKQFPDIFQGKLGEFGAYQYLKKYYEKLLKPDLRTYKKGIWETEDFDVNGKRVQVKSTKFIGHLLLIETKNYLKDGNDIYYLHAKEKKKIDLFILARIRPIMRELMKVFGFLNENILSDENKKILITKILETKWEFDIPGFATKEDMIKVINSNKIKYWDAPNYYIESGDLRDISTIKNFLT